MVRAVRGGQAGDRERRESRGAARAMCQWPCSGLWSAQYVPGYAIARRISCRRFRSSRGGPQLVRNQGQWLRQGTHWGWGRRFGEKRAVAYDAQEELRTVDERESHAGEKIHKHCTHTHTYHKHHTRRHKRCEDEEVWEVWGGRAGASAHDGHEYRTCTSTSAIQEPACRGDGVACTVVWRARRCSPVRAAPAVATIAARTGDSQKKSWFTRSTITCR